MSDITDDPSGETPESQAEESQAEESQAEESQAEEPAAEDVAAEDVAAEEPEAEPEPVAEGAAPAAGVQARKLPPLPAKPAPAAEPTGPSAGGSNVRVVVAIAVVALLVVIGVIVALITLTGSSSKSSSKLAADDVAVVGSTHLTLPLFNDLLAQAKQSFKAQGQAFPKPGTTGYQTIKGEAVSLMVQNAEREEQATALGITVTDAQVDKRLTALKKQYFGGSETKYKAQLKSQGLTDALVRFDVRSQLVQEGLFTKLTKNVTVSQKDVTAYYAANLTSKYSQPESRDLRHILVKSKTLAASIFKQLQAGNDQTWCKLAKKYSEDPSSKDKCGKLTVTKGETVPVFDKVAFSQPTKQVHAPVYDSAQYKAYFIIEPLSPIKPATTTPEKKVAASIKQTLLTTKKNDFMTAWVTKTSKDFCSGKKIAYQVGYAPSPDPCATLTSSTATNNTTT